MSLRPSLRLVVIRIYVESLTQTLSGTYTSWDVFELAYRGETIIRVETVTDGLCHPTVCN